MFERSLIAMSLHFIAVGYETELDADQKQQPCFWKKRDRYFCKQSQRDTSTVGSH